MTQTRTYRVDIDIIAYNSRYMLKTMLLLLLRLKVKRYSSPEHVISELWDVTCYMGSHSVTCHPTQVNTSGINPSQTAWYSIYLPWRNGRLS